MFSEAQCRQERQRRKTGCDKSCEWSELPSAPPYQQRPRHMHGWHCIARSGAAVHRELKFARRWEMSWEAGSKNVGWPVGKSSNNAYVTDAAIPSHGNATNNFATEAP